MNDKELLELAAKAAGIETMFWSGHDIGAESLVIQPDGLSWNPLTDDGDALRLAVELGMDVDVCVSRCGVGGNNTEVNCQHIEFHQDTDPYAATRRAIVRAAAALVSFKEFENGS